MKALRIFCIFWAVFFGLTAFSCIFNLFNQNRQEPIGELFVGGILMIALTALCVFGAMKSGDRPRKETRKYIPGSPLPVVRSGGLILSAGEVCHLCESVSIGKTKTVTTRTVTSRSGSSVRVARGVSLRSGTSTSRAIRQNVLDAVVGSFYVTNKRIVASSSKYSFDKSLSALSSYTMHTDGFALQFGNDTYTILTREPVYVMTILQVVLATYK